MPTQTAIVRVSLISGRKVISYVISAVEACLACCAACFIGMLQSLVEYFNRYAYIEIGEPLVRVSCDHALMMNSTAALYGKSYIPAAKDTWRLFKDRGIDALVNDSLVGMSKCVFKYP